MSTNRLASTNLVDVGSPILLEDCPLCVLTDAVSCPACNATGILVFRTADPMNEPAPAGRPSLN